MCEAVLKDYSRKFDDYDKDHLGHIVFEQFKELYREIENDPNKSVKEAKIAFDGIDFNNDKLIKKNKF
jgi:Ca2+-binding EF-hand superfamily protein